MPAKKRADVPVEARLVKERFQRPSRFVWTPLRVAPGGTFVKTTLWRLVPLQIHTTLPSWSTPVERGSKKLSMHADLRTGFGPAFSAARATARRARRRHEREANVPIAGERGCERDFLCHSS